MAEGIYEIALNTSVVDAVVLKVRVDWVGVDTLSSNGAATTHFDTTVALDSAGLGGADPDNSRFVARITGRF